MNERTTAGSKNINVLGDEELTKVVGGWGGHWRRHGGGGGMRRHGGGGMRRHDGDGAGRQRGGGQVVIIFINKGVINNGTINGDVVNNSEVDV
jgi:hypothetical protein